MAPVQLSLSSRAIVTVAVVLAMQVSVVSWALANGQTTHLWITEHALDLLPDGDLGDLLRRSELRDPLLNGTMFPDGGYAIGDDYGELAHWEPFQQAYLRWIRSSFEPPWNQGEAASHVAFLMGLASHGMADEVFDSLFMERSRCYDSGWETGTSHLDTASDVLFAAAVGGVVAPASWLPTDVLLALFQEELGYFVGVETVEEGHERLFLALAFTEWARTDQERLDSFAVEYAWSAEHLLDEAIPGSPPRESEVVAAYWQDLWWRLHAPELWEEPVLEFVPGDGALGHPVSAEAVESRLHLTFSRGVDAMGLDQVRVLDAEGTEVAVRVEHHYGDFSHTVHLKPEADWAADADYQVLIDGPVLNYDGVSLAEAWTADFSTRSAVPEPVNEEEPGCACGLSMDRSASGLVLGMLLVLGCWRRRVSCQPLGEHRLVGLVALSLALAASGCASPSGEADDLIETSSLPARALSGERDELPLEGQALEVQETQDKAVRQSDGTGLGCQDYIDCVCKMAERTRGLGLGPDTHDAHCSDAERHRSGVPDEECNRKLDAFKDELEVRGNLLLARILLPELETLAGGLDVLSNSVLREFSVPSLRQVAWTLWVRRNPSLPRASVLLLQGRTSGSFVACGNQGGEACP